MTCDLRSVIGDIPITNQQSLVTNDLVAWGPAMRSAAISHTSSHQPIVPSYLKELIRLCASHFGGTS
jgi:hypothetical protein